jgi:hypothetical protein
MSIDSDKLFNIYSVNKIIRNDGTIDLTNLEVLTSLNDFIKSHSSTPNSSLKLNDEDLLELININKNIDDTRTFLEKIDTFNYASNCSSNIELVIDTSKEVSPPQEEEEKEEEVSPPQEEEEKEEEVSPPPEEEEVSPPPEEEEVSPLQEEEEKDEEVTPGIINSITSLNIKTSSQPTRKASSQAIPSQATTRKASSQATTRKASSQATSSKATRKKGTK